MSVKKYPYCFGCGQDNPIGLRLKMRLEEGHLKSEFTPQENHQGWPEIVSGGIISSLLYEIIENVPYYLGIIAMTREMKLRFFKPARVGQRLFAEAYTLDRTGREVSLIGTLTSDEGSLIAEGNASMVLLREEQTQRLGIGR